MTVMFFDNISGPLTTSSTTWDEMGTKTGTLFEGEHWVWFSCEYGGILTTERVEVQVLSNGTPVANDYQIPQESNAFKSFSTLGQFNIPTDDTSQTISVEMRVESGSQTGAIRRIRLMVMKE